MKLQLPRETADDWQKFADCNRACFQPGGLLGMPTILIRYKNWTIQVEADIDQGLDYNWNTTTPKATFRIKTSLVVQEPLNQKGKAHLTKVVGDLGSGFCLHPNEMWSGPYYPRNVKLLVFKQARIPVNAVDLEQCYSRFCDMLDTLVAQSLAWEDDPTDLVGQKPRWRAIIKGGCWGLFWGLVGGLVLGLALTFMLGVRQSFDVILGAVIGLVFTPMLTVAAGLWTSAKFWSSGGKRYGRLYGTGVLRRFAQPEER